MKTIALGIIGFFIMVSCQQKPTQSNTQTNAKNYPVQKMVASDVDLHTVFPTVLKGEIDIEIKPRIDGFIEAVYVDEGSIVKKGQVLFEINSPVSEQNLETAEANYNTARLDVERMRPLAEKGIISDVLLESYENSFSSAKAAYESAKASLSWTKVKSPVDGIVGTLPYRLGTLVNSSSVLTTVANTQHVVAYFSMNEKELLEYMRSWEGNTQAEKIQNMPSVKLMLADGTEYEHAGRIETISGVVDVNTGSVNFRAVFDNPNGILRSGTSGQVIIPKTIKDVFLIPQKATFSQQDKVLVYKYDNNKVNQKVISVKSTPDGQYYAVLSGLESGDQIVTDGVSTLKNGMEIQIQ
ncbi:efflux RND transporter periplasmic adaptor subunit [Carboxylicivirga caseinilyticus]|uniref:efflux RND transporter periplasmic adaptor subunit n=1 Tax=Carboxylicivirga caseinilyticus TaxID=3417572 RepID=UPI003D3543ED|nr:efflux RND transporter periplasmic adaptor subunit [Marinilabiliaceae bacterium A049]